MKLDREKILDTAARDYYDKILNRSYIGLERLKYDQLSDQSRKAIKQIVQVILEAVLKEIPTIAVDRPENLDDVIQYIKMLEEFYYEVKGLGNGTR